MISQTQLASISHYGIPSLLQLQFAVRNLRIKLLALSHAQSLGLQVTLCQTPGPPLHGRSSGADQPLLHDAHAAETPFIQKFPVVNEV